MADVSNSSASSWSSGQEATYKFIELLLQTFFFGIYAVLIPLSTHILLKKGFGSRGTILMFWMTIFMFILSAAYWGVSIAATFTTLASYVHDPLHPPQTRSYKSIFNAVVLINYVLTDGVVVWRAWVIFQNGSKKILMLPIFFLGCTALSVISTISVRVAIFIMSDPHGDIPKSNPLTGIINITQVSNLILSLLTNITSTTIIGWNAWQHRRLIRENFHGDCNRSTQVEKVLALLTESGVLYCFSGITVLISSVIHLPGATLGDIYTPVNVQIAGIYPTLILILVSMQKSIDDTTRHSGGSGRTFQNVDHRPAPSQAQSIQFSLHFASNPNLVVSRESLRQGRQVQVGEVFQVDPKTDPESDLV